MYNFKIFLNYGHFEVDVEESEIWCKSHYEWHLTSVEDSGIYHF